MVWKPRKAKMNVSEVVQCLLALLVPYCSSQLVVNMKNKGGEVLRESIQVTFSHILLDPEDGM